MHTQFQLTRAFPSLWRGVVFLLCVCTGTLAQAQWKGATTRGTTGGLVIPSADVLPWSAMAISYGTYQEPQLGNFQIQQNASMGFGLLPYVELFGRLTNYETPVPGAILSNGIRDLSANVKVQIPLPWDGGPRLAGGFNDVTGGAVNFKSNYLVATDSYGPVDVTVGFAQGKSTGRALTFDGGFGGIAVRLADTGVSVLLEREGDAQHMGLRWDSGPVAALNGAKIIGTVQRSSGDAFQQGFAGKTDTALLSMVLPLGGAPGNLTTIKPSAVQALAAVSPEASNNPMQPTREDRLESLRKALVSAGFERVRVGTAHGMLGSEVVVEYENHRYAHNEVDAVGLVLGLASELSAPGLRRIRAVALKEGLVVHETSVDRTAYRGFLRGESPANARDSLVSETRSTYQEGATQWLGDSATAASPLRIEIRPELNTSYGTEVGVIDYALAANFTAIAPLWRGARVLSSFVVPVSHSANTEPGYAFSIFRQREGLKTVALQQSAWVGSRTLATLAVGQFFYESLGAQAEATYLLPSDADSIRLRAAGYNKVLNDVLGHGGAFAATYRHLFTPTMSVEAGVQRFSDGSSGPSVEWSQWFGDVALQIHYRRGDDRQFAGLQLSFPITPRRNATAGPVVIGGASQFSHGVRTFITSASQPANLVIPNGVRNIQLDTSQEVDMLNAGRFSQRYMETQLLRMRESFFLFGRHLVD